MSKAKPIEKLDTAPKFLAGMAGVINALVKRVNVLSSMEGDGKVVVAITDNNAKVMLGEKSQAAAGAGGISMRMIPASLGSIAGDLPSLSEVQAAIEDAYDSAGVAPAAGDIVYMTEFWYLIGGTAVNINEGTVTNNDVFRVVFTVEGVDYVGFGGPARLL